MDNLFISSIQRMVNLLDNKKNERNKNNTLSDYNIMFVSYIDVMVSDEIYRNLLGEDFLTKLVARPNREKLLKIRGESPEQVSIVPTLSSLLYALFGEHIHCDVIDFQLYEGSEIIVDLNEELPAELHEKYDIVFDGGSLEHVFDIALALQNLARAVTMGDIFTTACQ